MKLKILLPVFFGLCVATLSFAKETAPAKETKQVVKEEKKQDTNVTNIIKVSESFGHLIAKNIESLGLDFDTAKIIQGIQDSLAGKESPMNEAECIQAITQIQEEAFQKQSKDNLAKAEDFLNQNSLKNEIKEIEKGKLQYKMEKVGNGEIVKEEFSPTIRYVGKFLDGTVFGSSKEDEVISLKETIPGFAKGIVGMKEGEKRTLFIHPDLAYGTNGYLPPNSLLTFEIEVVKADNPAKEDAVATTDGDQPEEGPQHKEEAIR
ncbi:MAG: FKBP-type peptidyl-prolyl cis-trans isomerase [Chlamydiales bacterium]|nr:FKBP-type peptidyl-prolyl cis-trans isomerase [Chlamydiales bacterium]